MIGSRNINIQYKELLFDILENGYEYTDNKRNVKCKQIDETTLRIDLQQGFPAINLKKLYWKGVVGELLWFLRGDTNIKYLVDNNIHIWDKDAYNYWLKQKHPNTPNYKLDTFIDKVKTHDGKTTIYGDLGRVYGAQWGDYEGKVDQISNLIKNLKENPMSRRHIVTAWNPAELDDMALPPCHWSFEITVRPMNREQKIVNPGVYYGFTLKWHQRSVDTYLG